MQLKRSWLVGLIGLVVVLIFSLTILGDSDEPTSQLKPAPAVPRDRQIEVGMHIKNIYNFSLHDQTFSAEGWLWLKWPQSIQALIEADQIQPEHLVELANQIEGSDLDLHPETSEPERLADGRYLQLFRFSGKLYDDEQNLRNYPFATSALPVNVEVRRSEFSMGSAGVVLVPKVDASELRGDSVTFNGYSLAGVRIRDAIHAYSTSFGEEGVTRAGDYSQVSFEILYRTNGWAAFYRTILPWLAVMVIMVLAPNLEGSEQSPRLSIPSTALLTLVFLQQGAHSELPPLDYLTFLDKLYLFGYVMAAAEFWLFVWGTNLISRASASEQQRVAARINRIDLTYQVTAIGGAACLLLLGRASG